MRNSNSLEKRWKLIGLTRSRKCDFATPLRQRMSWPSSQISREPESPATPLTNQSPPLRPNSLGTLKPKPVYYKNKSARLKQIQSGPLRTGPRHSLLSSTREAPPKVVRFSPAPTLNLRKLLNPHYVLGPFFFQSYAALCFK